MNRYKDTIISIILSLIMVFFIWHNFFIGGNNIIFVFVLVLSFNFIKKTINIENKRANIISIIISAMFTIIEVICRSINQDYTINNIINKWLVVNLIGYFTIGWTSIKWIYKLLDNLKEQKLKEIKTNWLNNKYFFFTICFILIFLAWIPYFLRYFPGIVTSDSYTQIEQAIGIINLDNHHPIAHTAIISVFINLGLLIFKNINSAIALYSVVSMTLMAIFDALVLIYLKRKNTPPVILGILLIYYMFYPVNAMYSITMWKDILFSGIFPIFLILCNELIFNTDDFFKHKSNMVTYIMISFLMIVLRHNGLYVVIFTLPFFYIPLKRYWKKLSILFIGIFLINQIFNIFMFNILKVSKGSVVEMLSVPVQQIARVEKYHREELDEDMLNRINNIFITEKIGDYYDPGLSDPVKWKIDTEYFKQYKVECLKIWIKLFLKYPKEYIESFISNSYGYYYPEAFSDAVSRVTMDHNMGIEQKPKIEGKLVEEIDAFIDRRNVPLNSMLFSIGFAFWMIVICLGYKIYKKEYKYILIYLPIFILWLTCVASPVFCEFRYAYPMFTTLGLYISWNFMESNQNKENK